MLLFLFVGHHSGNDPIGVRPHESPSTSSGLLPGAGSHQNEGRDELLVNKTVDPTDTFLEGF